MAVSIDSEDLDELEILALRAIGAGYLRRSTLCPRCCSRMVNVNSKTGHCYRCDQELETIRATSHGPRRGDGTRELAAPISTTAVCLGISESQVEQLLAAGELEAREHAGRLLVTAASLAAYLDQDVVAEDRPACDVPAEENVVDQALTAIGRRVLADGAVCPRCLERRLDMDEDLEICSRCAVEYRETIREGKRRWKARQKAS